MDYYKNSCWGIGGLAGFPQSLRKGGGSARKRWKNGLKTRFPPPMRLFSKTGKFHIASLSELDDETILIH